MITLRIMTAAGLLLAAWMTTLDAQERAADERLVHTRTEFRFTANAALEQVAPLFGAEEERKWAPGWNPQFLFPNPARDQQGMVFQVSHGPYTSTWVNTVFDLTAGHIQYAYVLEGAMSTVIDIHLERDGANKTAVNVVYERTSLTPEANEHVRHFAKNDEKAGEEWQQQINSYLSDKQQK